MHKESCCVFLKMTLLGWLWIPFACDAIKAEQMDKASEILKATSVRGGLIIHIDCGDGRLTAALGAKNGYLVHGLATDAQDVKMARRHIRSLGLYGKVAVEQWSGKKLPYIDNLVNLVVAGERARVSMEEVMRVLRPGGAAYIQKKGKAVVRRKSWPEDIDEWTHFLHDASGNAVSQDRMVGPPRRMQWLAAPWWSRNHHKLASVSSVVSAQGRLFYIVDEATAGSMLVPGRWFLVARDAFNGVMLWKKPISSWAWELHGFRAGPVQLPRLLVASNDRVYAPLGLNEAVSALDAATGNIITTYKQTKGAEEIILNEGVLLVVKGQPIAEQAAIHPEWHQKKSFTNIKSIVAVNAKTAEELWTWQEQGAEVLMPLSLAAKDQRVFFQAGSDILCLSLHSGKLLWSSAHIPSDKDAPKHVEETSHPANRDDRKKNKSGKAKVLRWKRKVGWSTATIVVHDQIVFWADGEDLKALSVKDGTQLWHCPCKAGFRSPVDILVTDGLVWVGPDYNIGRDLQTGNIKRHLLELDDLRTVGHHHRCYREKATPRYIIGGYRGMEFFDLVGDNHSRNNWVRGTCQYGILPCNGLVYAPPHACGCFMEAKLYGFWALAPEGKPALWPEEHSRLQKGPHYTGTSLQTSACAAYSPEQWPTYRHDILRSGSTPSAVPSTLKQAWEVKITDRISPAVIAKDTVLISAIDEHRIIALAAGNGSIRWTFTAGGRIDSPPTIYGDMVLFGSADGYVYCLRLADGGLVWRFRASPQDLRTVAFDRIESVWPLHGSVLVLEGVAYVTAGRSSYLDGGIYMYGLEPATGKVLYKTRVRSTHPKADEGKEGPAEMTKKLTQNATDPKTFQAPDLSDAFSMKGGTTTDVLVSDGSSIFLRTFKFSKECVQQQGRSHHLFSTSSLLDGAENHRSHWVIGTGDFSRMPVAYSWIANRPGNYNSYVAVPYGLMLVFDDETVWGIRRLNGYTLFADRHSPFTGGDEQLPDVRAVPRRNFRFNWEWSKVVNIRPRALVRAGDVLLLGGLPMLTGRENSPEAFASFEGHGKGILWVMSAQDGAKLNAVTLESGPVWDGIAVANGRVYISRMDGVLECLSGK